MPVATRYPPAGNAFPGSKYRNAPAEAGAF